jgi:hypothetical protein
MGAAWVRARSELRRRRASTVAFILLVGLAGAVVMATVAGGRRTSGAMDRFLAYNRPPQVFVGSEQANQVDDATSQAERLPAVADFDRRSYVLLVPTTADGRPDREHAVNPFTVDNGRLGTSFGRPVVVAGRQPLPGRADEVTVNETAAHQHHLGPGSRFTVIAFAPDQADQAVGPDAPLPAGVHLTLTVVGIERRPYDLAASLSTTKEQTSYESIRGDLYLPAAFAAAHRDDVPILGTASFIRLKPGTTTQAFAADVHRRFGDAVFVAIGSDEERIANIVGRAARVQAVALYAFAGLTALAVALVLGQSLARQVAVESADFRALQAIGFDRAGLVASAVVRVAVIAIGGGLAAVAVAIPASRLFPFGVAKDAELHPGISLDAPVLAAGFVLVVTAVIARGAWAAWRLARPPVAAAHTGRASLGSRLAAAGVPTPAATGVDLALRPGGGSTAIPVRPALLGSAFAVAAIVAALTFASSLDHLLGTPRLQGWTWHAAAGNPNVPVDPTDATNALRANDRVAAATSVSQLARDADIGGRHVSVIGVDYVAGRLFPPLLEGRAPAGRNELVLGRQTLHDLHAHLGATVAVEGRRMRIVGVGILPAGLSDTDRSLGVGAMVDRASLQEAAPDLLPPGQYLVRFRPGVALAKGVDSLRPLFGTDVATRLTPLVLVNLRRVSGLPFVLAGVLAVLATATVTHALVTTVRRRRRDLALLKTLGFVRRQVATTVAAQATTFAVLALVVGIPIGAVIGRLAWRIAADQLGTLGEPQVPLGAVALGVPVALVVFNLAAGVPARIAARVRPAVVLRAE